MSGTVINKYGTSGVVQTSKVSGLLIMLLVERPSQTGFLDIYFTTYFGVRNLGNISAMRVLIFLKIFKT